jgi:chorismate dehydratase
MNIATMPFINVAPYFHFLSARWLGQHRVVSAVPRQLGDLARLGKVDAGAFSYVDGLELVASGEFEWLGSMGIAGHGAIGSILLCGAEGSSVLRGQAIAVSPQTATTVRLLEIWLRQKEGVSDYRLTGPDDNAAARLLIGDEALRRKLSLGSQEVQIDLSEAWTAWTGLPFVFARWAVRAALPEREKKELALTLSSALDLALEDLDHVADEQAHRTGLETADIQAYLRGIRYKLGPAELAGAAEFKRRLDLL